MSKLSLIVAVYKNEFNIIPFYEDFNKNIVPFIDDYELIMVNDDSPDNSWEVMKGIAKNDKHVKLLRHSKNFGSYPAEFSGMRYATGDVIITKACDLQEPAELTVQMYNEWKKGEKVVLAVRESRNDSKAGDFFSNLYYFIMKKAVNPDMPKGGFDVMAIDKSVRDILLEMNDKNSPTSLQVLWLGFHPKYVYYERKKREIGKSSWTFAKKYKLFIDSLIAFSYLPVRIMSGIGAFFLLFSFIEIIQTIVGRLRGEIPVQGYTTLLIIVTFSAGLIMFTLGILGEYIWRTMESSRNLPISVVQDAINFDDEETEEN